MLWIIIGIFVVVALAAIVILTGNVTGKKVTREEHLLKLEEFLGAKSKPIDGYENSYRIDFEFEGKQFVYEDLEVLGFRGMVYKVNLRYQMDNQFTLSFLEKEVSGAVRSDMLIISNVPREVQEKKVQVNIPNSLKMFRVHTNDVNCTNRFLSDRKVESILLSFKNADNRGRPFLSLQMINGEIILNFHESILYKPSIDTIRSEMHRLEEYIDRIVELSKRIKIDKEN